MCRSSVNSGVLRGVAQRASFFLYVSPSSCSFLHVCVLSAPGLFLAGNEIGFWRGRHECERSSFTRYSTIVSSSRVCLYSEELLFIDVGYVVSACLFY